MFSLIIKPTADQAARSHRRSAGPFRVCGALLSAAVAAITAVARDITRLISNLLSCLMIRLSSRKAANTDDARDPRGHPALAECSKGSKRLFRSASEVSGPDNEISGPEESRRRQRRPRRGATCLPGEPCTGRGHRRDTEGVVTALIAVAGTLLGSGITFYFQWITANRTTRQTLLTAGVRSSRTPARTSPLRWRRWRYAPPQALPTRRPRRATALLRGTPTPLA